MRKALKNLGYGMLFLGGFLASAYEGLSSYERYSMEKDKDRPVIIRRDMNNDGITDSVELKKAKELGISFYTLGIRMGRPDGSLAEERTIYKFFEFRPQITVKDVDGDGILDIEFSSQVYGKGEMVEYSNGFFKGKGDGTFRKSRLPKG